MISVSEASKIVAGHTILLPTAAVSLEQAQGRILAEDILADREFPPFDRVMMDGVAIDSNAWDRGRRTFRITGVAAAGSPRASLDSDDGCIEAMTGAMLPEGTDAVIPYELLEISEKVATLKTDVRAGQNIHKQGLDRSEGSILVPAGTTIGAAEIGVLATVGKASIQVSEKIQLAIISTGDELVNVNETPLPYQIRRSNNYAIGGLLSALPVACSHHHLNDDKESIRIQLTELLRTQHALILSGGVSKGKFDFIPEVLAELGLEKHFHRVAQRPGKPMWFGTHPGGCVVFALPGNPVSSFMTTRRYVIPWIHASLGCTGPMQMAELAEPFTFKPPLTYFLQVRTETDAVGRRLACPVTGKGSGDHANLVDVDGFLELDASQTDFDKGQTFAFWSFR